MPRAPRIILYGVGRYGCEFARLAEARGWPIVAAVNRAGDKVGQPLAMLAGTRDTSVIVQDCSLADLAGAQADVGVVFTTDLLRDNLPAYRRLFEAGVDVLCHGVQSYYPWRYDPENSAILHGLALAAGRSFTGSGIWDMSRIWAGILLAGPCVAITSLRHRSVTQVNYPSPRLVADYGLDLTPEDYAGRFGIASEHADTYRLIGKYQSITEHVLSALGYHVTGGAERREPLTADIPVYCKALARDIAPGRVIGWSYRSTVETVEGVSAHASMEMRLLDDDVPETMAWEIDGRPGNRLVVERRDSITASAASILNRIPDVIAASPGIHLLSQLGPMRSTAPYKGGLT
ncbi:hypothetical protein ACMT1E_10830 [Sphingomonas flavalba]|uniref:hypothetical protein n=1 Tax=Sphingomonas flavalba TaxID=2559804 RepID=UPI0039DFC3D2